MAASDASPFPIKNQAYRVTFPILDADGDLVTGAASLDTELSADGGTFADATNEATEIATSSGMYYLDLTATEMNADTVAIIVKLSTTGAKTTPIVLYPVTLTEAMLGVDVVQISGDSTAADNLEAACDGGTYNVGGGAVVAASVTAEVTANVAKISGDATAADRLEAMLDAMPSGAVVDDNDPDPTTLLFETNLSEATNDHYNGAFVVITSGALLGQSRLISDYDGTTKVVTVATAFTEAPAAADTFIILGRSE